MKKSILFLLVAGLLLVGTNTQARRIDDHRITKLSQHDFNYISDQIQSVNQLQFYKDTMLPYCGDWLADPGSPGGDGFQQTCVYPGVGGYYLVCYKKKACYYCPITECKCYDTFGGPYSCGGID